MGNPINVSPLTDWTDRNEHDFGSTTGGNYTYGPVGTADVTFGVNIGSEGDPLGVIGVAIAESGGGGSATLTAAQGSYSLTGQPATTRRALLTSAAPGSYTYTGQAAATLWDHLVTAQQGAYTVTGQPATTSTVFAAHGIEFDGTDHLTRGADLTGNADGSDATGSFWFKTTGTSDAFYQNAAGTVGVAITGFGRVNVFGYDAGFSNGFDVQSSVVNDDAWHHCAWSYNGSTVQLYIDDAADIASGGIVGAGGAVDFADSDHAIGATPAGGGKYVGCLGEYYMNLAERLDLSVEANRRKFITAAGRPANLGSDGSLPTGTAPIVYLGGNGQQAAGWESNKGSGGGFTENGTLADCATDPEIDLGETLAAAQGSYSVSGQAAATRWAHVMGAAQGGYTVTGQPALLAQGHVMAAAQGSFVYTGQPALLAQGHVMAAAQGSYTLSGQDAATLASTVRLLAEAGVYDVSGQAAGLVRTFTPLAAAYGSYALNGQPITFSLAELWAAATDAAGGWGAAAAADDIWSNARTSADGWSDA